MMQRAHSALVRRKDLPAIESSHTGWGAGHGNTPGARVLVGLSGRGDKDMATLLRGLEVEHDPVEQLEAAEVQEQHGLVAYLTAGWPTKEACGTPGEHRAGRRRRRDRCAFRRWRMDRHRGQPRGPGQRGDAGLDPGDADGLSVSAPLLLMGYLNPFLAYGLERRRDARGGISGFIVPDLPLDDDISDHGDRGYGWSSWSGDPAVASSSSPLREGSPTR